ncbi:MAG: hypothetical protein FJX54_15015 [Alphaproteobacteria bacterium]|nr:hypothetical protein [Alphaproteobacteria bacterium]
MPLLSLLALLSVGQAMAQPLPFEGRWAMKLEWCVAKDGQPPPIRLTAKRLDAIVMTCDFTSVLPGGVSHRVEADCVAGKDRGREFFGFAKLDDRLYWNWGSRTEGYVRCPD